MLLNVLQKNLDGLYTSLFLPKEWAGETILYVHGGPGSHCGDFESGLRKFPELLTQRFAWLTYDQRGCGRSEPVKIECLSHRRNIDDLKNLISSIPAQYGYPEMRLALYGHSYGARLVYDALHTSSDLDTRAIISGRSIHPLDAMNTSILIDAMILRNIDPASFKKAYEIISSHIGEPFERARQIRECFPDSVQRQKLRQAYYWVNHDALEWWNATSATLGLHDSDDIYFQVASSYEDEVFNAGIFDPSLLSQPCLLIQGFFDVLMNGTANPRLIRNSGAVKFNGSAHYPHFEQPELFMKTVGTFLSRCAEMAN